MITLPILIENVNSAETPKLLNTADSSAEMETQFKENLPVGI